MKFYALVFTLALTACTTKPATTPAPTGELTAIGIHATQLKSYAVANKQAIKFCSRWDMSPNIINKVTTYNGKAPEGTTEALNRVAAITHIPLGNNDAYETTITYKCY